MNRLFNFLLITDQKNKLDFDVEKVLRKIGRVLTVGKQKENYQIDFELNGNDTLSVSHIVEQLPENAKPDIIFVTQHTYSWVKDFPDNSMKVLCNGERGAIIDSNFKAIQIVNDIQAVEEHFQIQVPYQGDEIAPKVFAECLRIIYGQTELKTYQQLLSLGFSLNRKKSESRAFVIAILDESPASPYGIKTLLDDLNDIDGEVICVFNSEEMSDMYKDHPRITRSASISQNVGVGRAWNIGMMLTEADTVFILNADLHIGNEGVEKLERTLYQDANIAVAGPCGGYTDFSTMQDLRYLENKMYPDYSIVDQVSGFYFAIKRSLFLNYQLMFYPEYLPCYMEEWDLAMQLKKYDLLAVVTYINDYDHKWGGTTEGLSEIHCLGKVYQINEVLKQSQQKFFEKWLNSFKEMKNKVYLPLT